MNIFGILNVTTDSFSDGGKYLAPEAALAHVRRLVKEGADVIDIGAASSNPDAGRVTPEVEIARLVYLVPRMRDSGNAERQRGAIRSYGSSEISQASTSGREVYRVRIGPYTTADAAGIVADRLKRSGYGDARVISD